jgi:hypothetical protein
MSNVLLLFMRWLVAWLEWVMSAHQANRTWQSDLIARHPALFTITENGQTSTPGWPTVGDGWRELVETAVGRIADAVASAPAGSLRIVQIKEKFAGLRLYWQSAGLSDEIKNAVEEAIYLAEARSACTCEQCGEPGRLYKSGGWFLTACDEHARGEVVEVRPGRENIHIVRTLKDGKLSIVSCRRYVRESDSFVDVSPSDLGIKE